MCVSSVASCGEWAVPVATARRRSRHRPPPSRLDHLRVECPVSSSGQRRQRAGDRASVPVLHGVQGGDERLELSVVVARCAA
jgi:hypothetical protein